MPFIPTPNCVQLELVYDWDGQRCQNVLHYVKSAPWDSSDMFELCEQAKDTWNTYIVSRVSDTLSLVEIKCIDLSSQTGLVVNYTTGLPIQGGQTSPSLPNNCALVVTKRTLKRGRSYRGRIYHPGLVEGFVTGNNVLGATATAIRDAWDNFRGINLPVAVDDALMVVLSYYENNAPRAQGEATLVENLTVNTVVDSQRRRLPGRGA